MEVVIITGLSGAGKSQAANALEDIGYFCIDNMPPTLIPRFAEMSLQINKYNNVAIVTDVRTGEFFSGFFDAVDELRKIHVKCKILFLDADDDVLERRYRATRRKHPLATSDKTSLAQAIADERVMLRPVSDISDYRIDTSLLSMPQLKEQILSIFMSNSNNSMLVRCLSFGYKYGVPTESDLMLDVRCLPNPFYVDELKEKNGMDSAVHDYVYSNGEAAELIQRFFNLIDYLLPLYKEEGKSQLVIGIGCTGDKHRSVAIAEDLSAHISRLGFDCRTIHRDVNKLM
ncbi:MAG: RNase adapter RapZ [Oscillospiraceae bacterium]